MYKEKRSAQSTFVPIRSLQYHLLQWVEGPVRPDLPPLVLVHGWMDVGASYQFMVDALDPGFAAGRRIIAPDWRGFGKTQARADNFWFPDYLADLDFLLDAIAPGQQVDLVGHSMGGNVALCYAGVRPQRIRRAVNLEGFGLAASRPSQAPGRYAQWMDEIKGLYAGQIELRSYPDAASVAQRLIKTNPRLSQDKAQWLALHWAQPDAQGQWHILGEAAHKIKNAYLYRWDEMQEIWQRITAPVLSVVAGDDSLSQWWKGSYTLDQYHERLKNIAQVQSVRIDNAGHMLHHDQPQVLAQAIEAFLA
jgi:pimeloyl-ACP methyl ester carboxylesterase